MELRLGFVRAGVNTIAPRGSGECERLQRDEPKASKGARRGVWWWAGERAGDRCRVTVCV